MDNAKVIKGLEQCICEFEGLYKGQKHKLLICNDTGNGELVFRTIMPNYCPFCGKELPKEPDE